MIYKAHCYWGCGTLSNIQYDDDDDIMLRQTQSPPAPALHSSGNNFIMEPCFIIITNRHWLSRGTQTTDDQVIGHANPAHGTRQMVVLRNPIQSDLHPVNWPGLGGKCGVTKGAEQQQQALPNPFWLWLECECEIQNPLRRREEGGHLTDLI